MVQDPQCSLQHWTDTLGGVWTLLAGYVTLRSHSGSRHVCALFVHSLSTACAKAQPVYKMAIVAEVAVRKVSSRTVVTLDDKQATILSLECEVHGSAGGCTRIHVRIHSRFATFDQEHWRLITLTQGPFDHTDAFTGLFAASCGSIGKFTDIKRLEDGTFAIPVTMQKYSFPFRQLNGRWMGQVYPFDPEWLCTQVHPSGALLFAPFRSQLTLLQHLCIQWDLLDRPPQLIAKLPRYWLEEDRSMALLEENRWRSHKTLNWLKTHGHSYVPVSIREELMILAHGNFAGGASSSLSPPPGDVP